MTLPFRRAILGAASFAGTSLYPHSCEVKGKYKKQHNQLSSVSYALLVAAFLCLISVGWHNIYTRYCFQRQSRKCGMSMSNNRFMLYAAYSDSPKKSLYHTRNIYIAQILRLLSFLPFLWSSSSLTISSTLKNSAAAGDVKASFTVL